MVASKERWRVVTSDGTIETTAVSRRQAEGHARWRLIMGDRAYSRPTARDLRWMREIEVVRCERLTVQ